MNLKFHLFFTIIVFIGRFKKNSLAGAHKKLELARPTKIYLLGLKHSLILMKKNTKYRSSGFISDKAHVSLFIIVYSLQKVQYKSKFKFKLPLDMISIHAFLYLQLPDYVGDLGRAYYELK